MFPYLYHCLCVTFFCLLYSAAVYANRHYLNIYRRTHPERLAQNGEGKPQIHGDVFIHPTASVHPSAVVSKNKQLAYTIFFT